MTAGIWTESAELVGRLQAGEATAFNELVAQYQKPIYNLILRLVGTAPEAEDLAQEVFLKAYQGISSYQKRANLYTWLYRIAINLCRDYWRRQRRTGQPLSIEASEHRQVIAATNLALELEQKELAQTLINALKHLSTEQRVIVVLHDLQGFTYGEIAKICGISLGTVKSRLYYARRALRSYLRGGEQDEPKQGTRPVPLR